MTSREKKILIIFYSMYGHVETLAREILAGVNSIKGVKGELWRLPETLPEEVLKLMRAPKKSEDIPILSYEKLDMMIEADGYLFGIPTRFGMMPAQCKTFWDMTGVYWKKRSFLGKSAGFFFSTSTQGGGQETTALTAITQLTHHGMVYVPIGYGYGDESATMDEIKGGSAYGAGTYSGSDNMRNPTELELRIARYHGEYFAKYVSKISK
jgi:NAD(P)H dehydrogenase (quinone)